MNIPLGFVQKNGYHGCTIIAYPSLSWTHSLAAIHPPFSTDVNWYQGMELQMTHYTVLTDSIGQQIHYCVKWVEDYAEVYTQSNWENKVSTHRQQRRVRERRQWGKWVAACNLWIEIFGYLNWEARAVVSNM